MVKRFVFGEPFDTEAVKVKPEICKEKIPYFENKGNRFSLSMDSSDIVYGLGENVRGINKRGFIYESFCTDQPEHNENKRSLYGAHNFFIVSGREKNFGVFFDSPGKITFDIGATNYSMIEITVENPGYELYIIENPTLELIIREFRTLIGRSYIPPRWAFGIGQSRWGYNCEEDIKSVAENYRKNNIPLDMIYLDIDYMDKFKDFTINNNAFPNFKDFVSGMKKNSIRIIPIIDAGIKIEDGFEIYEEGKSFNYFCKDKDGKDFAAGVWPGKCCFPDFINPEARKWFGMKYKFLTDQGIEGFWNDMNEPALFYSEKNLEKVFSEINEMKKDNIGLKENFALKDAVLNLANNENDYKSFYHCKDGKKFRNYDIHNIYGYNMTRAAYEAFEKISPEKRMLIFSRSSSIGAHRYGGIWMGDNMSRWSHILLNLKMLPSLNMCGFLYTGADLGGFGENTTEDLLLRWYSLGIFMPLLRNHSALGTREQEPFRFNDSIEKFRNILRLRYRLLPYIYSEFMKAALQGTMYASPLGFLWPEDEDARRTEDQLMIGESIMIAPVYEQNASGRHVYLPEEMKLIKFTSSESYEEKIIPPGHNFIHVELNEVALFIRKGHILPLADSAESVEKINLENLKILSFAEKNAGYALYTDDGECRNPSLNENLKTIRA